MLFWFCFGFFVSSDRREIPANLDHNLADMSKPVIVVDPETNTEVPLGELNGCEQGISWIM